MQNFGYFCDCTFVPVHAKCQNLCSALIIIVCNFDFYITLFFTKMINRESKIIHSNT